ncbi:ABC transporter permease [Actinoplanes friuliensis]|uniref:Transport permease protein n=1 Tax=Actinoplanes friuliensis DSM 7358 TaxID=1246995 RepID=U5W0N6_9ACTN|nr:ABC transporter permease [Actinoplanes friuliensis]AGZ42684.1 multidrug ABC transporter permease [Actinoplanes friuliensis DSM 7358]
MTTLALTVRDSNTMLRRNLRHMLRYPALTVMLAGMPVIFLLLFVYVFGGTLGAGLGGGRSEYLAYVVPGVLMMTVGGAATGTAISVAMDMTEGIVARFRTMAIARASVLTGHVLGSLIQTFISLLIVLGVALAVGFRPSAGPLAWLGIAGVLAMATFALTWLATALGLVAKTVEEASNTPLPLTLLPFLGSGFVPTDSMAPGLRQFAEYQPFTPIMETIRALLTGTPVGGNLWASIAWCAAIALGGYLWARRRYNAKA